MTVDQCFWFASCLPEMAEEVITLVLRGSCPVSVCLEADENVTKPCRRGALSFRPGWNRILPQGNVFNRL